MEGKVMNQESEAFVLNSWCSFKPLFLKYSQVPHLQGLNNSS